MPQRIGGHEVHRWSLLEAQRTNLSDLAFRVFSALLVRRDFKTDTTAITRAQLAALIGKSEQTVWRAINELKAAGLISETRKKQTASYPMNVFVLDLSSVNKSGGAEAQIRAPLSTSTPSTSGSTSTSTSTKALNNSGRRRVGASRRRDQNRPSRTDVSPSLTAPDACPVSDWSRFGISPDEAERRGLTAVDFSNFVLLQEGNDSQVDERSQVTPRRE